MDILAFVLALLDIASGIPGGRVTVKQRYEMKRKVRELKKREERKRVTKSK